MSNDFDPATKPADLKGFMAQSKAFNRAIRTVIATTNGHPWIRAFGMTCCRDCGIVRRMDDQNKPCRGPVKVGPR